MTYAFVTDDVYAGPCGLHATRTEIMWQDDNHATLAFWAIGDKIDAPPRKVQTFKKKDVIFCEDEDTAQEIGMRIPLALSAYRSACNAASEKLKTEINRLRSVVK